jgi:hypothetical protein
MGTADEAFKIAGLKGRSRDTAGRATGKNDMVGAPGKTDASSAHEATWDGADRPW